MEAAHTDSRVDDARRLRTRALTMIASSQLLVLTLWFSASAIAPQLEDVWNLGETQSTALTLAVQIGFVVGALGVAMSGIADAVPARRLFLVAGLTGATANALLTALDERMFLVALMLRFVTGVSLAGVYPSGLKVMAGWFTSGRGMALGVLVGALTVGSAGPHLIRGVGFDWRGVLLGASLLAVAGTAIMTRWVTDGPDEPAPSPFSWHLVGSVVRNRGVRLSTYGYLGHMWELYAMWTWTAAFLAASAVARGDGTGWVPLATFGVIASGGVGAWAAGALADRHGRTTIAGGSMAMSGACAIVSPLVFAAHPGVVLALFVVWGVTVVADSAQFSTMVTEVSDGRHRGTALALQTALGFLLTLVTIRGVPLIAGAVGWRWAFPWLALGPVFGIVAMVRLRRLPEAEMLAGGRG